MGKVVKNRSGGAASSRRGLTRISAKHQVTIPSEAFRQAGLATGDRLRVEAAGAGRVVFARLTDVLDELSGCLRTGGELRRSVDAGRSEWE